MRARVLNGSERVVRIIPAKVEQPTHDSCKRQKNACAYARVSTEAEEQQHSYENQINYYTKKLMSNKEWNFVGVYADEGISGTQLKNRDEFNRMIEDCRKGKIDVILIKSISRYARNTVDSVSLMRELKALGVAILFEKENINTLDIDGETFFTLLSCMAQAESESISKNVTWGVQRNFADGSVRYNFKNWYGYIKGPDGQPQIVPEEAEAVKKMFALYLAGRSTTQIAREFNEIGIPRRSGQKEWTPNSIYLILQNERYCGDALSQKTYTTDCLTHKSVKNRGELAQYYVEDCHPGIIDRDTLKRAQEEKARRTRKRKVDPTDSSRQNSKYSGKYALSEVLYCGQCGTAYRRMSGHLRNGVRKVYWRCACRVDHGGKYCARDGGIQEYLLQDAVMAEIQKFASDRNLLVENLKENFERALLKERGADTLLAVEAKIGEVNALCAELLDSTLELDEPGANEEKLRLLTRELEELQAKADRMRALDESLLRDIHDAEVKELVETLDAIPLAARGFDDDLVRLTITGIEVLEENLLEIQFRDGSKARRACCK